MTGAEPLLDAHLVVDARRFRLDLRLRDRGRRGRRAARPERRRQDHRAARAGRPAAADRRPRHARRRPLDRPTVDCGRPPERRPIGVVFQDYLLFPHLTALDNVAFGPRRHGVDRRGARAAGGRLAGPGRAGRARPAQAPAAVRRAGAAGRAGPGPRRRPGLLLLDEPLAALDARTRLDTRAELHRHLAEHPGATAAGHPRPARRAGARRPAGHHRGRPDRAGGRRRHDHRPAAHRLRRPARRPQPLPGHAPTATPSASPATSRSPSRTRSTATCSSRSRRPPSRCYTEPPDGSPRNTWPATVTGIQRHGDNLRVQLAGPIAVAADVTPAAAASCGSPPGNRSGPR